ncbi:hypothetical protein U1Q18_050149, partial [Sarracenia purpurea var. burkii]
VTGGELWYVKQVMELTDGTYSVGTDFVPSTNSAVKEQQVLESNENTILKDDLRISKIPFSRGRALRRF